MSPKGRKAGEWYDDAPEPPRGAVVPDGNGTSRVFDGPARDAFIEAVFCCMNPGAANAGVRDASPKTAAICERMLRISQRSLPSLTERDLGE
jgi:hypothetical protein